MNYFTQISRGPWESTINGTWNLNGGCIRHLQGEYLFFFIV